MLWFGITASDADSGEYLEQQMHGPFCDTDHLEDAINEVIIEVTSQWSDAIVIPLRFELCTDDVPELVSNEEMRT